MHFISVLTVLLSLGTTIATALPGGGNGHGNGHGSGKQCNKWCKNSFDVKHDRKSCKSQAKQGQGPCYICGPEKPAADTHMLLCDQQCVDTLTDTEHCGGCGIACKSYEKCSSGTCVPSGPFRARLRTVNPSNPQEVATYRPDAVEAFQWTVDPEEALILTIPAPPEDGSSLTVEGVSFEVAEGKLYNERNIRLLGLRNRYYWRHFEAVGFNYAIPIEMRYPDELVSYHQAPVWNVNYETLQVTAHVTNPDGTKSTGEWGTNADRTTAMFNDMSTHSQWNYWPIDLVLEPIEE